MRAIRVLNQLFSPALIVHTQYPNGQRKVNRWSDRHTNASKIHVWRERNPTVVRKKKRQVLRETGRLSCEACDFDFAATYGELGTGYAECHHVLPLSQSVQGRKTN